PSPSSEGLPSMTTLPAEIGANGRTAVAASVERLLAQIRPEWQAKLLIERVRKLHDLREKIIIAGLDVAAEAASPSPSRSQQCVSAPAQRRDSNTHYQLVIQSGEMDGRCPPYPQKRTLELGRGMSALCQKRTSDWVNLRLTFE